jgi:HEAT repeat protein
VGSLAVALSRRAAFAALCRVCSLGALSALAACTSVPARVALQGNLPALQAAIVQAEQKDELGSSHVHELANAVLRRELLSQVAPSEPFPDVAACARQIRPVLEHVAGGASEYSAPAALALLDAGLGAPDPARGDAVSRDAIEARQALGSAAGPRRRGFMLHGEAAVRRAALSAAFAGADPADTAALGEAARLDPDERARAIAARALGRIGGPAAVVALADVYASASPAERREIVLAWSQPASFASGGQQKLEDLIAGAATPESVLAAAALSSRGGTASPLATRLLSVAIEGKVLETRLFALQVAPWSNAELRSKIEAARKHEDPATRVLALSRVARAGALDAGARKELEVLGTDPVTAVGVVARAALANAGAAEVKGALRADLSKPDSDRRTLAALSLVALKDWAGAARALGDDSPEVRRVIACSLLSDPVAVTSASFDVVPLLLSPQPG